MEQHPIPQQISSYEFKLVGEMTLKQFLKAAGGILLAVLINSTKIIVIVKWPLMLFFGGLGLLLAFVPFEDRPLETWITAFIRSIYAPTVFLYKKKNDGSWLEFKTTQSETETDEPEEGVEKKNLFVSAVKDTDWAKEKFIREKFSLRRKNKGLMDEGEKNTVEEEAVEALKAMEVTKEPAATPAKTEETKVEETKTVDWRDEKANLNLKTEKLGATGKAVFGSIPMPDRANVIVGMATTTQGKIIDGVIVEIQDSHGNPARVIKTNLLGQFKISTPLTDGRYLIIAEKDGYTFDRVNVDLTGKIVDPIRIIANN